MDAIAMSHRWCIWRVIVRADNATGFEERLCLPKRFSWQQSGRWCPTAEGRDAPLGNGPPSDRLQPAKSGLPTPKEDRSKPVIRIVCRGAAYNLATVLLSTRVPLAKIVDQESAGGFRPRIGTRLWIGHF